jgi:hypothetical protein
LDNYILKIEFSNGKIRKFDCTPYLNGDWFSELLDKSKFNTVRIFGRTVEWAGGYDLAPDFLFKNAFKIKKPLAGLFFNV